MILSTDDAALVHKFVRGESVLLAGQALRIESASDSIHLLTSQGKVIATAQIANNPYTIFVRRGTQYWEQLNTALRDNGYLAVSSEDLPGFMRYEHRRIPAGYKINYTEARVLWQTWWMNVRHSGDRPQHDFLISIANDWHPVRHISHTQGTLVIRTWIGETIRKGEDFVFWLSCAQSSLAGADRVPQAPDSQVSTLASVEQNRRSPVTQSSHGIGGTTANLHQVLRCTPGKLHIQTEIGEIIVWGKDLKFSLNRTAS